MKVENIFALFPYKGIKKNSNGKVIAYIFSFFLFAM